MGRIAATSAVVMWVAVRVLEALNGSLQQALDRTGNTMRSLTALDAELAAPEIGADAGRVIRDLPRIMRRMLPSGIRLDVAADVSAWTALGSTDLLRVVSNLVINARDAIATRGTIQVSVSATPTHVLVDIVDDGAGMDAETRGRVFEPFFTTKPLGLGTGLGLTSARALVERAGGSITLESTLGQGTHSGSYSGESRAPNYFSKAKIRFQSFFMLMTIQPCF